MASENRIAIWKSMEEYREILKPDNKGWLVLEVGIDGDEKPSGNFKYFGKGNFWETLDNLPDLKPDIIADITNTNLPDGYYDLIICSQVLEHIFDFKKVIEEVYRILKTDGYAILDCPFEFPYHGLSAYDDYWRISDTALLKLVKDIGFKAIICKRIGPLTTALVKKPERRNL